MKISFISKYRSCLIALSMLWIAIRHSNFPIHFKPLGFLLYTCGYGGVDAFLFLSGFGIYYACKKERQYSDFLKRRLLKILPYSIVVTAILFILGRKTLSNALVEGFGLTVWLRADLINWYTSFILFLYLLTPFYFKLFKKKPLIVTTATIIIVWLLCLFLNDRNVYIFFRTGIYVLGIYFGYLNEKYPELNCWWLPLLTIVGFAAIYWLYHYVNNDILHTQPFLLIIPGLMVFVGWLLDKLSFLQKPLAAMAPYTFQFYLIHEEVVAYLYSYYEVLYRPGIYFDYLINIAAIILAFILAVILKRIVDLLLTRIVRN